MLWQGALCIVVDERGVTVNVLCQMCSVVRWTCNWQGLCVVVDGRGVIVNVPDGQCGEVDLWFTRTVCCGWQRFQELEEEHICQMKDFVDTYVKAWENQHVLLGQVHACLFHFDMGGGGVRVGGGGGWSWIVKGGWWRGCSCVCIFGWDGGGGGAKLDIVSTLLKFF